MSRLNDVDLLGAPRSCRRLPAAAWLAWLVLLLVLAAGAIVARAFA